MFVSDVLKTHLETSATIQTEALVLAEWNMNMPDNILMLGNYRYRPLGSDLKYKTLPIVFDKLDAGNYFTGATDADVVFDGGVDNSNIPILFTSKKQKNKMLYSLEDCVKQFRPRSGINKPLYFAGNYINHSHSTMSQRPRYYMASRDDQFKYWTSYRTEENIERGIAKNVVNGINNIDDAVPFVVYKEKVPANRLIVKMQTNVGSINLGPFTTSTGSVSDPLFGTVNSTTPVKWKVQVLKENSWVDAKTFDSTSVRKDGSPIIQSDGYLELHYGLIIPDKYLDTFIFAGQISSATLLPTQSLPGYAYLVVPNANELGTFYIWNGDMSRYDTFVPNYGWTVGSETISPSTNFVTDTTAPISFVANNATYYREFEYIQGMRIVVETMNKFNSSFDLIEMSPRLVVNLSDSVVDFTIRKSLSDLGNTSLPVGQLLASTGSVKIFDSDLSFNSNNKDSIIGKYLRKNIKFSFYDKILNVSGYDYCVPIKTLYSEGIPQEDSGAGTVNIELRDLFFFLESMPAPRMLLTQVSLSYVISILLDYIGFSNYSFKRLSTEKDPIIPYFFVAPDQNVAQVLQDIAVSTQSAMFFDEYNNFIVMGKDYLMPSNNERAIDFTITGSNNALDTGVVENASGSVLPNILSISSEDRKVFNDGKISYKTRYIQRSYGSIKQSLMTDQEKTWIYKPALLWEVAGTDVTKTINQTVTKQSKYVLGAIPINSSVPATPPTVVKNVLTNNTIDLGEGAYWLTRFQGYFYSNGEIIRYDAAQFNVTGTGNVWIKDNQEYQNYFSSLPFNGKIYPTGLVRIFATPYYETIDGITRLKNGDVQEHGRAQFGTSITSHTAGIDSYWSNNEYVRGCNMDAGHLFTTSLEPVLPETEVGPAGIDNATAKKTTRNGVIKNFMSTAFATETEVGSLQSTKSGTIQSSAFVMNGPSFKTDETPINFISYVYKTLDNAYKHFGTRMRIIGKIESSETRSQTPLGSMPYYQLNNPSPNQNVSISGGSGGLAIMLNPETNNGYYFEIIALTENNLESYLNLDTNGNTTVALYNVVFYKVKKDVASNTAIPIRLWGGLTNVLVDNGRFTGQYRMANEQNSTVNDLSVEYQTVGKVRRFYLYMNNKLIATVDDSDPLPVYNNMALFTRGSSKVMFENIYALAENYSQNTVFTVNETLSSVFGDQQINANESFRKYAMSGMVQATYLSGISAQQPPKYNMYFEEFGSIMRECAYFSIRYDRAYPALYAQLSPTFNRTKGYVTSGFYADSYGAEFMIFNATDAALNLDETAGNYLRIQGITFTQDSSNELTVDQYFNKRGNLSDPQLVGSTLTYSPLVEQSRYNEIKLSRMTYGKNEFAIDTPYIQTDDDANALMGWIIKKLMTPKRSVGIQMFSIPTLQLGDIVNINYKDENNKDIVATTDTKFVIYNIEYTRNEDGPSMTIYLSEV